MAGGFEALGLAPELVRSVTEDLGYLLPTNVQVTAAGDYLLLLSLVYIVYNRTFVGYISSVYLDRQAFL